MASVDDDIQLVRELIAWADSNPARMAKAIGVANTTLNRFSNGTAKTRLGRETLEKLRAEYPTFPGFVARPPSNATQVNFEGASLERMRNDLPVYGSALGAARKVDGEAVEQIMLNSAETVEYIRRPVMLNDRPEVYGLLVSGSSMEPRHMDGETIIVDPKGKIRNNEDVVIYLRPSGDEDDGERARAVLVKKLVRRTSNYYELEQYTPALTFRIDTADILRVDRVLPWSELLS